MSTASVAIKELEKAKKARDAYHSRVIELTRQRDALLTVLQAALARLDRLDDAATGEHSPAYLQIKATIDKAEGRAE